MRENRHETVLGLGGGAGALLLHRQLALLFFRPFPFRHVGNGGAETIRAVVALCARLTAQKLRYEFSPVAAGQSHLADHSLRPVALLAAAPHVLEKRRPVRLIHITEKRRADDAIALHVQQRGAGEIDVQHHPIAIQGEIGDRRKVV